MNNESFRLSIVHGLDRVNALQAKDFADPESLLSNTITPLGAASASQDYAYYGGLEKYTDGDTFDPDLALEYKETAMEELAAEGCTFPVIVYYPYNPNETNADSMAQLVEQQLENLLGTDYIDVVIQQGNESFLSTVRRAGNYGFTLCNWGADYSDASAYVVDPFAEDSSYSFIYESDDPETQSFYQEYLDLVETGLATTDDIEARMRPSPRRSASCWTTASPSPFTPTPGSTPSPSSTPWRAPTPPSASPPCGTSISTSWRRPWAWREFEQGLSDLAGRAGGRAGRSRPVNSIRCFPGAQPP